MSGATADRGHAKRRRHRRFLLAVLARLAPAIAAIGAVGHPARAQQAPPVLAPAAPAPVPSAPPGGPQILVTPFLFLSGINTAISTGLPRVPTVDSSVGAFQLLGHLDGIPFMGAIEIRDGPFSLLGDSFHVPVGTNVTTRNVFFDGGNAALTANQGTADFLYHWLDEPVQQLDAGIGFRAWSFNTNLTLNGRIAPTISITRSAQWADPLVALRYHREFGNGFGGTLYADLGGFGVGAHIDWQIFGTIDYALSPRASLRLGYLSLNFNYTAADSIGFNVHMKGPILAATFRF
jgi:hypothetical protein